MENERNKNNPWPRTLASLVSVLVLCGVVTSSQGKGVSRLEENVKDIYKIKVKYALDHNHDGNPDGLVLDLSGDIEEIIPNEKGYQILLKRSKKALVYKN